MTHPPDRADLRRRAAVVARHAVQRLLPMALGTALSLAVVRWHGAAVWGAWVAALLVWQLTAHVVGWGNKDDVLRRLSRDGAEPGPTLRAHAWLRLRALAPVAGAVMLAVGVAADWPFELLGLAAAWLVLRVLSQSFEALVLHEQGFLRGAAADALATLVPLLGVLAAGPSSGAGALTRELLGGLFVAGELLRLLTLVGLFPAARQRATGPGPATGGRAGRGGAALATVSTLRAGLPFFLVGAAGLLGSRVDLYCVAALLPDAEVARYQVLVNALLWLQSVAGFTLTPFARDLYRLDYPALLRLLARFSGLGVLVGVAGSAGLTALVRLAYHLPMSAALSVLGAAYVAQMFVHVPAIFMLYKADRERDVLRMSVGILVVNGALNLAAIPVWGVEGALAASALTGWGAAGLYVRAARRVGRGADPQPTPGAR